MTIQSDEQLVSEIQEGNILAFETLIKRFQNRLFIFILRIVKNESDAKDIVQEVFIRMYRTIERIDPKRKFSSYLYTIAKNESISFIRAKKNHMPLDTVEIVSDDESHVDRLVTLGKREVVVHAIQRLRDIQRRVIRLYYFDELSYEEISKRLHLPINTIRTHLRRAKARLKELLKHEKNN